MSLTEIDNRLLGLQVSSQMLFRDREEVVAIAGRREEISNLSPQTSRKVDTTIVYIISQEPIANQMIAPVASKMGILRRRAVDMANRTTHLLRIRKQCRHRKAMIRLIVV
jgi:hypothetical protein